MFESFENKISNEGVSLGGSLDGLKINESDMRAECSDIVRDFYNEGIDVKYEDSGLQGRYEIANQFYSYIQNSMGGSAELSFEPMPTDSLGGYNPDHNIITLNSNYLESPNSEDLLDTILHETRHAFQQKAIEDPSSVSVNAEILNSWRDNFENYIPPEFDFEAYTNQPVEVDANNFANEVMTNGFESNEYLTEIA